MNHLSPAEFIDAADGTLPATRQAHLQGCARCVEQAAHVRSALDVARVSDVPEPSPLYWEHMAARVRAGVANERPGSESWWQAFGMRRLLPLTAAVALVVGAVASGTLFRQGQQVAAPAIVVSAPENVASADDSEVWDMLTSAASDAPFDEAHADGLVVSAGAVDRAVLRMTPEERDALGRLLQDEMKGPGH